MINVRMYKKGLGVTKVIPCCSCGNPLYFTNLVPDVCQYCHKEKPIEATMKILEDKSKLIAYHLGTTI